jgi:hypothetical protein
MPKLKLHKIIGKLNKENVEFILTNKKESKNNLIKILKELKGSNKVLISEPNLSEENEFKIKEKIIKFKYLNSFSSNTIKKEQLIPFYVYSLVFEGVSSNGKKYYVERVLGFFNKEKNKINISDWRFKVNSRITKELIHSENNEIAIALEEVEINDGENKIRELYVGTPLSLISELQKEKENK